MIKHATALATFVLFFSGPISAATINFEDLSIGDSGLSLVSGGATFTVSGQGNTGGHPRELMIFDGTCGESGPFPGSSTNCSGNDSDLYFPDQANILIISEDNDSSDPDDSRHGGSILVDFTEVIVSITSLLLDADETITITALLDSAVQETLILNSGDGESITAMFDASTQADQLRFHFAGSGAIGNIEYAVIPVPAALPLLLSALAVIARQRR